MGAKMQFEADVIQGHKGVTAVIVPFDPREAWGEEPIALDDRRRGWLVRGKVDGKPFHGWIGFRWGRHFIMLDGAKPGARVEIVVEPTRDAAALEVAHVQAKRTTAPPRERGAETAAAALRRFLDRYDPAIATRARGVLAALRRRLPGALELISDHYEALAVAFAPTERAGDAIFSVGVFPREVRLYFLRDATRLPDPERRLAGTARQNRHVVLDRGARTLADPAVAALIDEALRRAPTAIDPGGKRRMLIKTVAEKQRPRRSR